MKLIFRYIKTYAKTVLLCIFIKLLATIAELLLPYVLEHMIDEVVPNGQKSDVWGWGGAMFICALLALWFNVWANRTAIDNAHNISYDLRRDLFNKTIHLSGETFDQFGLPSITSRMTSDSYNVQNFVRAMQTICIRAPMLLVGGIFLAMTMDFTLSLILCSMVPILFLVVLTISRRGVRLYRNVQSKLDQVLRTMRENITGIRVVKALSKSEYEKKRFQKHNNEMTDADIRTSTIMGISSPFMQLCLNIGLTLVVYVGAVRVNEGWMKPGVILAFLTYFNLVMQSIMAINRMFMMISKASASAGRIESVLNANEGLPLSTAQPKENTPFITFDDVSFVYHHSKHLDNQTLPMTLDRITFTLEKGESLGIIGPTGCGKTTVINLLMRFYDVDSGRILIDGENIKTIPKDKLHSLFGVVFQNDFIFMDSLYENISFGRNLDMEEIKKAAVDAQAFSFIDSLDDKFKHMADIKGGNLSGGQKQRLLIARALAGNPDILILDDASSALDYKTDAKLRKAVMESHRESATIMIAQRISSVMGMDRILVLDNGRCIGYDTHEKLLETCDTYREIYHAQMGALD